MRILVPLDGSETAQRVLPAIKRTLAAVPNAEVHLLDVLSPKSAKGQADKEAPTELQPALTSQTLPAANRRIVEDHGAALQRVRIEACESLERVASQFLPGVNVVVHAEWSRKPEEAIVELALALKVGIIAMATHGRSGLSHVVAGSVTEGVLRLSPIPVLVVGPTYVAPGS